jgi:hypothetical protein
MLPELEARCWESQQGLEVVFLNDEAQIPSLVALYRDIFGNDPVWREGAYCVKEGWQKRINLREYEEAINHGELPVCKCGARLIPCHLPFEVEHKILSILNDPSGFVCMLYQEKSLVGFSWGAVLDLSGCCERIMRTRYLGREQEGKVDLESLKASLKDRFQTKERLLYIEEVAICHESRSLEAGMILIEATLFAGFDRQASKSLYWTSPQAAIYKFGLCSGFVPCTEAEDGNEYLWCENLVASVKLLRQTPPSKFVFHCAAVLRRVKT